MLEDMTNNLKAHVLDPDAMDTSVRPQDDLYRYVNGAWLDSYQIPADLTSYGSFVALRDLSEERCRTLVEGISSDDTDPDAQRIRLMYTQFMDQEEANRLGIAPIQGLLDRVQGVDSHEALAELLGEFSRIGISAFFYQAVEPDLDDPTRWAVYLGQGGLGLPDESYYHKSEYEPYRVAYLQHIANLLQLANLAESEEVATEQATRVLAFETQLADLHWDVVKCRDWPAQNNPRTWEEICQQNPGFAWHPWMRQLRLTHPQSRRFLVQQPDFLESGAQLFQNTELEVLKLWLFRKVISRFAPYLADDLVQENYEFYSKTLAGTEQIKPRWKRALRLVEGTLGEALGRLYVAQHFPPEAKERMDELVANLLDAYRDSITELDWMTEATKREALAKLDTFTPKIGYPVKWRDYSKLTLSPKATLVENLIAASEFETEWELSRIDQPVDRDEWAMTPQTVNAYYNPQWNEIVFPAAILQPPFFNVKADDAVNYAAIGAVIGHEIGHGFDDSGSSFDGTGAMRNWWTDQDRKEFAARTQKLVEQYDQYTPAGLDPTEYKVQGALTLGENIGDLSGLTIAWKAYVKALRKRGLEDPAEDQVINGLSAPERFFYSWARIWRQKSRKDYQIQLLAVDPHSPTEFRCNGVLANFDEFAKYFDLQPTDALYRAPEDRVKIW